MKNKKVKNTATREREREREREQLLKRPTVKELIRELEYKNSKKILEKPNFDFLLKLIKKADTEDEIVNICTLGTSYYQTGLKFSPKLETETGKIHYLNKNKKLSFKQKNGELNKFIIGDNYHALHNLLISHRNKIDVIYIDPPYGCNDMGEGTKEIYDNEHLSRNHLLSSLKPRLLLAKQLLSNNGVIFCSIDDKNQAYIKCLLDDIFYERNFLNTLDVINMYEGRHMNFNGQGCMTCKEYVLIYAKNKNNIFWKVDWNFIEKNGLHKRTYDLKETDIYSDEISQYKKGSSLDNNTGLTNQNTHPNLIYEIYFNPKSHNVLFGNERGISKTIPNNFLYKSQKGYYCLKNKIDGPHRIVPWRHEAKRILSNINDYIFDFDKNSKTLKNIYIKDRNINKTWVKDFIIKKNSGTSELKNILTKTKFSNPKSVWFIKYLLSFFDKKDQVILDFYAGSGTTGQAVLELNKEDGGNRKFILCTNNENNIAFDVTYERCKRVMTGKSSDDSKFDWQKNAPLGGSLDVIEIKEASSLDPESIDKIDETVYELEKFTNINKKIEWVCSNFDITTKKLGE